MGSACFCFIRPRCFFLLLCYMQLLLLLIRQTFDFFGHLWTCILVNFFGILICIVGIFGGHQRRPGYILLYVLWQVLSLSWNVFLICFYLDIGPYTQSTLGDFNIINLGTGSRSWFEANGHGCTASYNISDLNDYLQLIKPVEVFGCYLDYRIIECIQCGLQLLLSINTSCISFFLIYAFSKPKQQQDFEYDGQLNAPAAVIDTALPPYSLSVPSRQNQVNRSMRSVNQQSLRKNSNQRSSTRSTKSHRSARRSRGGNPATAGRLSQHASAELYGTYGRRRRSASASRANGLSNGGGGHHQFQTYDSSSRLQLQQAGDSSSLDSYGARTNHAYHESRNSLHKDAESAYAAYGHQSMTPATTLSTVPSVSNYTMNSVTSNSRNEAIYNIYSSNPYNTYGRSVGRQQQRPSSFCSNASSSSNIAASSNFVSSNPAGGGGSTFQIAAHSSRASPIYMNSETRI